MKEVLVNMFLYDENDVAIINILKSEGKSTMGKQLETGQISVENLVMSEDYFATLLDFWILSKDLISL